MSKHLLLIKKLVDRTISLKEKEILEQWIKKNDSNKIVFLNTIKTLEEKKNTIFDSDIAFEKFMQKIDKKQKPLFRINHFYKYAAAILVLFTIGYTITTKVNTELPSKVVTHQSNTETINKDVITITLADGSTKVITEENISSLKNSKGQTVANKGANGLIFESNENDNTLVYNEISIPNGKTFKLQLSDGTIVWLNSGSYFKFPQDFKYASNNRKVYLTGEAFFDVSSNKNKPFIVDNDGVSVEVLGTQFNVSSYKNEEHIATTLVEGAVKVYDDKSRNNTVQLSPGFQASFNKNDGNINTKKVNPEEYISWINNKLSINNLKLHQILYKLERKYDVTIINNTLNMDNAIYKGEFSNETIETILETISLSTHFNYEIEGKTITIHN